MQTVPEKTLSRRALNRATLARQMLLRREKVKPVTAIERLAGMQAQLARPPFIGLWSRIEQFRRDDLIGAIERREVVRATMMRGTLHLASRQDFVRFRLVLQPMLALGAKAVLRDRANGINVDALVKAARVCFDKKPCTFDELRRHLSARFPGLDERAMGYTVRMHLPLVQIPAEGSAWAYPASSDFAVAESWLGGKLDAGDRPHTFALSYLAAFGPATLRDLQTWSGLAVAPAVLDELRPKLRTFVDERGRELFPRRRARMRTKNRRSGSCRSSTIFSSHLPIERGSSPTSIGRRSTRRTCSSPRRFSLTASRRAPGRPNEKRRPPGWPSNRSAG
jgi:Winged helix DNA-binding domain